MNLFDLNITTLLSRLPVDKQVFLAGQEGHPTCNTAISLPRHLGRRQFSNTWASKMGALARSHFPRLHFLRLYDTFFFSAMAPPLFTCYDHIHIKAKREVWDRETKTFGT